jgi:modulator of FtsH protease HflK
MPWNTSEPGGPSGGSGNGNRGEGGGPSPWGSPGGSRPGPDRSSGPNRPGGGPQGPWGGGPRGPGGPGGPPDLDDLIARAQGFVRGIIPPGMGGGGGGPGRGFSGWRGFLLIAAVLAVFWLGSGFYRVQPDEQGVVMRFGAFDRVTLPGLNYHMPWPIERAMTPAVTRVNRIEVGYRSAGDFNVDTRAPTQAVRDISAESLMLTGDENIVDINFAVFWRIRNVGEFLFNTRNPAYTVKSAAESEMREVIGRTPIQPALTDARARIEAEVMKGVQGILDQYRSGVEITQVQLQKVDPPAAVVESFRDVQRANTDADRARNEAESYHNDIVPRARGDAARIVAEADAARQSGIAQAGGEAQRFLSVLQAYDAAKDVTMQRLYIETMQDILSHTPSIVVDNRLQGIVPFLPLGEGARPPLPAPPRPIPPPVPAAGAKP